MQYSLVALVALAATASASYKNETTTSTVSYTTETVSAYTTYCPYATEVTVHGQTYTASASAYLTVTNGPFTVVKPCTTSSVVYPTSAPVYTNKTTTVATYPVASTSTPKPTPITASSGNKAFAFSGASLAGLLGLAAYIL